VTTPDRLRSAGLVCLAVLVSAPAGAPSRAQTPPALRKDYAMIFGTVWDKNNRPVHGAIIKIRRQGDKKPRWELMSDRSGEFAQRVPTGKADYVVWIDNTRSVADAAVARRKFKPGQVEARVHIDHDERADISLHLTE
jgi:hypothetical protein